MHYLAVKYVQSDIVRPDFIPAHLSLHKQNTCQIMQLLLFQVLGLIKAFSGKEMRCSRLMEPSAGASLKKFQLVRLPANKINS